VSELFINF